MECEEFILPDWSPPDNLFLVTSLDFRKSIFFPDLLPHLTRHAKQIGITEGHKKIQNYRPRNTLLQAIFVFYWEYIGISMGKLLYCAYHVGVWFKYDRFGSN